jgi:UDP-N-acetylglucosamine--N-acetylmuramyl-(pentapeptide) pyrophosphoryl-undecaprenol N-acetylglucosamine transferase
MVCGAEILSRRAPRFQIIHLTGPDDRAKVREQYFRHELRAVVLPFLTEMELALGAATVAVSRAGASSLAELAAMRLPSVLIPYPTAADNHQYFNARAYARTGAARLFEQRSATPEALVAALIEMALEGGVRSRAQAALKAWYAPEAAARVRDAMLDHLQRRALLGRRGRLDTGRADRASSLRRSGRGERFDANGCAPWDRETTGLGVQASAGADWDFESGDR